MAVPEFDFGAEGAHAAAFNLCWHGPQFTTKRPAFAGEPFRPELPRVQWVGEMMRNAYSSLIRTLVTVVIGGCIGGTGSGLVGISGGNGGNGSNTPPVLGFFVQPNSANVGQIISPPVEVVARDSVGNIDSAFTGSITISLASNSTGAALSGTTVVRPANGIASFSNLAIDKAGTYTLQVSASGATSVTSTAFSITTVTGP